MPKEIKYADAPFAMQHTWDRLMQANTALEAIRGKSIPLDELDKIRKEHAAATNAYWKACRAAGHIRRNGRTTTPHLV